MGITAGTVGAQAALQLGREVCCRFAADAAE